nr:Uma2 family endonuclease [Argonema galeatum]
MTPQKYLEWEEDQNIKYEYVNGEVFAMTGGTIPHNAIALNLASSLKNHFRGGSCRAFMADVKVRVSEKGPFHYPDVMVTCDDRDRQAIQFIQYPCLIAEVLSPGTRGFDRGDKFTHYRRIETLREYILINSRRINVDCYRLNERGIWELHPYEEGEEIHFTSVDFHFPIALLYEDVQLPN